MWSFIGSAAYGLLDGMATLKSKFMMLLFSRIPRQRFKGGSRITRRLDRHPDESCPELKMLAVGKQMRHIHFIFIIDMLYPPFLEKCE